MFKELEVVELAHDIKENKLKEGNRGTVVEIYKDGEAYEVEFISPDGKTSVLLTLSPVDIRSLSREVYYSSGLNTPIYLDMSTVSGVAVDLTSKGLSKRTYPFNLEIRTEISENKTTEKPFYYQNSAI